jgi:hypothetical protein
VVAWAGRRAVSVGNRRILCRGIIESGPPRRRQDGNGGLTLTVTDADQGWVVARERVEPGALVDLLYVHSMEGRPVRATFRMEADVTVRLVETVCPIIGPGLPLEPEDPWTIEEGQIVSRGPRPPLVELRLRTVPLTRHRLRMPSGRMLDLGTLAEPGNAIRVTVR